MSEEFDWNNPPQEVADDLTNLRAALDEVIPEKKLDRNLLVATWNIRAFSDLTKKWTSESGNSPIRDYRSVLYIAEIVSRFDVMAIQEVKTNLRALRYMMRVLGPHWSFLLTDENRGNKGNNERLAYVYDTRRVNPSGLACELVIPEDLEGAVAANSFQTQFCRTPYAVSFNSAGKTFILTTLHVLYGSSGNPAARVPELAAIATWLSNWAEREKNWGHNLILLGDFNIDREGDALFDAFTSTGLGIPAELRNLPRTTSSVLGQPDTDKHYDQIAWFRDDAEVPHLTLDYQTGGNFNFVESVDILSDLGEPKIEWRVSDHYPLWVEFGVR